MNPIRINPLGNKTVCGRLRFLYEQIIMEYPQEYSRSQSAQAMDIPKDQRIHKDFIHLSRKSLIFAQGPTDTLAYSCYAP